MTGASPTRTISVLKRLMRYSENFGIAFQLDHFHWARGDLPHVPFSIRFQPTRISVRFVHALPLPSESAPWIIPPSTSPPLRPNNPDPPPPHPQPSPSRGSSFMLGGRSPRRLVQFYKLWMNRRTVG